MAASSSLSHMRSPLWYGTAVEYVIALPPALLLATAFVVAFWLGARG